MKLAKIFLSLAIAVVFVVFVGYGVETFYETPKYDDSYNQCYNQFKCENITMDKCPQPLDPNAPAAVCNYNPSTDSAWQTCNDNVNKCVEDMKYTTPRYFHSRNSFFILTIIALASIIGGMFLVKRLDSIGSGIIGGGVATAIWALIYTSEYWMLWNKYVKFIALGIVLVVLIVFGYKKIEEKLKK